MSTKSLIIWATVGFITMNLLLLVPDARRAEFFMPMAWAIYALSAYLVIMLNRLFPRKEH